MSLVARVTLFAHWMLVMRPIAAPSSPASVSRTAEVAVAACQNEQRARVAAEAAQSQRAGRERLREEQRDRWGHVSRSGSSRSEKPRPLTNNLLGLMALSHPVATTGRSEEFGVEHLSQHEQSPASGTDVGHEEMLPHGSLAFHWRDAPAPGPTRATKPPSQRSPASMPGSPPSDGEDVRAVPVLHPHAPEAATDLFDMPVPPVDPVMSFDPDIGPGRRDRGRGLLLVFAVLLMLVSIMSAIVVLTLGQPEPTEKASPAHLSNPQAVR